MGKEDGWRAVRERGDTDTRSSHVCLYTRSFSHYASDTHSHSISTHREFEFVFVWVFERERVCARAKQSFVCIWNVTLHIQSNTQVQIKHMNASDRARARNTHTGKITPNTIHTCTSRRRER